MGQSLVLLSPATAADNPLDGFDEYVLAAMHQWQVPGLAVAIVKDGELIYSRGYGIRKLGQPEPVTAHTRFPIGSCTKSFTALALGMLHDRNKLHWDDPVQNHLPGFQLYDPFLTREATLRDLLAHRTGLELADPLWSKNEFTPDEIIRRLRYIKPKHSFRSRFVYNNLMYLAAGRIIENASGQPWPAFIQSQILEPLEMHATTTAFPDTTDAPDVAWPHAEIDGQVQPIALEPHYADSIAPAGAIWSTASDMAQWIRLNLAGGKLGTHQLIRPDTLREMHSPQILIPTANNGTVYPPKAFRSYGLGWFVDDYRGHKLVWHSGSRNGFVAWVALLPEERLGFVILANVHRTGINFALHHRILDAFLGQPPKDWSTIVFDDYTTGWKKSLRDARSAFDRRRRLGTKPTLPLAAYAGTYRSDLYGDLTIRHEHNTLELRFGPRRIAPLQHWQLDTFRATFSNPMLEPWHVTFALSPDAATVTSLHPRAAPWAPPWYDDSPDLGPFRRLQENTNDN